VFPWCVCVYFVVSVCLSREALFEQRYYFIECVYECCSAILFVILYALIISLKVKWFGKNYLFILFNFGNAMLTFVSCTRTVVNICWRVLVVFDDLKQILSDIKWTDIRRTRKHVDLMIVPCWFVCNILHIY